jgi:hypothetical protein
MIDLHMHEGRLAIGFALQSMAADLWKSPLLLLVCSIW